MFLNKLAEELISKFGNDISKICVVFSSRRACLYFKKCLGQKFDKPVFSPSVFSLEDFYEHLSPYGLADRLELVLELNKVYSELSGTDDFVRFYPWGSMLLDDFNEIDKNLADASGLFKAISEQKEIEHDFRINLAEYESLRKFWATFSSNPIAGEGKDFSALWEMTAVLYKKFRESLQAKKIAYEGMLQRAVYQDIVNKKISIEWKEIIFAGLNFLNEVDRKLIKHFFKLGNARTYWDADEYYVFDKKMEAGRFLRENFKSLDIGEPEWLENLLTDSKKKFNFVGAPLMSGQSKALGELLKRHIKEHGEDDTLIVLPEEKMLQPVMHSIPEEVQNLNITMGYPFRYTQFFTLLHSLNLLHKNLKFRSGRAVFFYKDVDSIISHPYIGGQARGNISQVVAEVKRKNLVYVTVDKLLELATGSREENEIISKIFRCPKEDECFDYVFGILDYIYSNFISKTTWNIETEHFSVLYEQTVRLSKLSRKYEMKYDVLSFWNLFIEILRNVKIPFTGEPLKGLQVMGLLETRTLDFKNVFILSLNEGVLPKGYAHYSFIPHDLKKRHKLPTFEEFDAAAAYNFYRLLQRAENIYLIYNTEVSDNELFSGEKSRFILQLEIELLKNSGSRNVITTASVLVPKVREITVRNSEDILNKLKHLTLSASDLITYIACPLKFYLSKIAGLKEDDEVSETLGAGDFGNILHAVMANLYRKFVGKEITAEDIGKLIVLLQKGYDGILEDALQDITRSHDFEVEGMNLLYKEVVRKLAVRILENDRKEAPFAILGIEENVAAELPVNSSGSIKVKGRIDRVEMKDGCIRILDYKTGRKVVPPKNDEMFFDTIFSNPQYKETFQLYLYAYLYDKELTNIRVGIYPVKRLGAGINFLAEENIPPQHFLLFEDKLKTLLGKMFNPDVPFSQTPDVKNCLYCTFTSMCYRD